MIGIAVVEAPWGPIHLAASEDAVVALEVMTTPGQFADGVRRRLGEVPEPVSDGRFGRTGSAGSRRVRARLASGAEAVRLLLDGDGAALDGLPFELIGLSAWDRIVLEGVRRVRRGTVTSYGRLARAIGRPGAARAVGGSVGRNPIGLVIPCHRVIAGDGTLGGYGGGWFGDREALLAIKRELLRAEGIELPVASIGPWA